MKTKVLHLFSIAMIILVGITSCKKDYPRDIPDWLKEKIKERKNTCEERGCYCNDGSGLCWNVVEFNHNGEIKYVITEGEIDITKTVKMLVYSCDGNLICNTNVIAYPNSLAQCDNVLQSIKVRDIWNENPGIYK